ncbi:hypothetical protein VF04_04455 [Nostoc linckia z7]|uniref:Uncharacterized protein n=2 Tax=Nostoc linckia TaxID=92942 RepID=A0A9Q5ZGA0_NOSLI|nr:hypothetical protein [Nostoc linckia]PHK42962.1 hypothetical protein VF12_01155 [Nostoc linckia z15]PHK48119.1 hypothetical protein VF13_02130 [Nostoc linckia z16]PHJ65039.1 hypothetical protein VF02_11940 [Nostoc linckia z1]PHJ70080.1 hypothetical protein VF05_11335 [Nostoc linckia z3]PHJ75118.1 hypothetical protein VF03_12260 [Nostoc linckia z2]
MQLLQINTLRKPKYQVSINKIVIKGDWEIQIDYELPSQDTERKNVKLFCKERPTKQFIEAFEKLKPNLYTICGLDRKIWEPGRITSIRFKEQEQGTMLSITLRVVSEEAIAIAGTEELYPKGEFLDKVNNLIAELEDYINGVREAQQMTIDGYLEGQKDNG